MSTLDKNYQEKRDFMRMKIDAPLPVTLDYQDQILTGMCRELSGGGMQVTLEQPLPEGAELELKLASPHGHNPELHARARVVRVSAGEEGDQLIGLELLALLE